MTSTPSSSSSSQPISTSLTLPCGVTVPHRLCKAAMSEGLCDARTNRPGPEYVRLYQRWAQGGVALAITGNVMIDRRHMEAPYGAALEAGDAYNLQPYRDWAAAVKSKGALAIMQINHPGRQAPFSTSREPIAPSAVPLRAFGLPAYMSPSYVARAMTQDEIHDVITRFVTTAKLAIQSGFDGIQIHAAHGYLISQFLSPYANIRTDEWGGNPVNRRRLLMEILKALREILPSHIIISIKLNSSDYQTSGTRDTGFTMEQSMDVIQACQQYKVDFIEISGGTYENTVMFSQTSKTSTLEREAFFMEYVQQARKQFPHVLFMLTGGFRSRAAMNRVIETGEVNLIGLARPMAVQPDLPQYLMTSTEPDSIVRSREYNITMNVGHPRISHVLNMALQGIWHMAQLSRMSRGLDPDIHINCTTTLVSGMSAQMFPLQRYLNSSFKNGFLTALATVLLLASIIYMFQ